MLTSSSMPPFVLSLTLFSDSQTKANTLTDDTQEIDKIFIERKHEEAFHKKMNPFKVGCGRGRKRKAKSVVEVKQEPGIKEEPNDGDYVIDVRRPRADGEYHGNYGGNGMVDFGDDFGEVKDEIKSKEGEEVDKGTKSTPCERSDEWIAANDEGNEEQLGYAIGVQPSRPVGSGKKHNRSSKRRNKRTAHRNQVAKKQKKYKFHVCNHLANDNYALKAHLRIHTGEKPFKCHVCSKSFTRKYTLNSHKNLHGKFHCSKCNHGFEQESARIDHERFCNPRQFECDICGYRTINKSDLILHMRIHSGAKPFECPICFKSFKTKFELQRHSMTHIDELPNACSKCGRRFATPEDKQTHEMRCQRKSIRCEICNIQFVQQLKLNQHLYTTHNDQFPFQCSKCFGAYATEDAKIAHEESCGHRQYQCHLCKEHRRDKQHLKIHMRKDHTGERIRCKVCAASFTIKSNAVKHMKTVHGLKK